MTWQTEVAARTLAMEARGEPLEGQQAVAWTMRNRLETGRWGRNLASVCLWHAQFSGWWCPRGKPSYLDPNFAYACGLMEDDPLLVKMRNVVNSVLAAPAESDPTGGATHYYATSIPEPSWVAEMTFTVQIWRHKFYVEGQIKVPPTSSVGVA